jgi:tetratricopeptide (TPR) repeat protein
MLHTEEHIQRTAHQRELGSRLLRQADAFVKRKNYVAALDSIRSAQVADPYNPYCSAYEDLVQTLLIHDQEQAPPSPPAPTDGIRQYLIRAELFVNNGNYTDALEEVANATTINPGDPDVDRLRAVILSHLKTDTVQDRLQRISTTKKLQLDPRRPIDRL